MDTNTHYALSVGSEGGYLPFRSDLYCTLGDALEAMGDELERLADGMDATRDACGCDTWPADERDGMAECEDCRTLDAYAELAYATRDALSGLDEDTMPSQVKIMGENEPTEYVRDHGTYVLLPNGTVFGTIVSVRPVDRSEWPTADDVRMDGSEPCDHVLSATV